MSLRGYALGAVRLSCPFRSPFTRIGSPSRQTRIGAANISTLVSVVEDGFGVLASRSRGALSCCAEAEIGGKRPADIAPSKTKSDFHLTEIDLIRLPSLFVTEYL